MELSNDAPIDVRRIGIILAAAAVLAVTVGSAPAAAHNPACHQVAGSDGPHYDDDPRTGSTTAFEKNENFGGDEFGGPDHVAMCPVGNSESSRSDH